MLELLLRRSAAPLDTTALFATLYHTYQRGNWAVPVPGDGLVLVYSANYEYLTGRRSRDGHFLASTARLAFQPHASGGSSPGANTANRGASANGEVSANFTAMPDLTTCTDWYDGSTGGYLTTTGDCSGWDGGDYIPPYTGPSTTGPGGYDPNPTTGGGGGGNTPKAISAGKFRVNPAYEVLSPKLVQVLKNLRVLVESNPKLLVALMKFSGQTQAQIMRDLTYGIGPEVKLGQPVDKNLNPVIGQFRASMPDVLILDGAFINQLQHTSSAAANDALSFYLAVTLLHEYTHYGDYANGIHFPGEEGTAFEQAVFGVVVGEDNAGQVLVELTNKP
jgi:hypothetical protein